MTFTLSHLIRRALAWQRAAQIEKQKLSRQGRESELILASNKITDALTRLSEYFVALGPFGLFAVALLDGRGDGATGLIASFRGGEMEVLETLTALGPAGALAFRRPPDQRSALAELSEAAATLRREFAAAVTSGVAPALDVNRGLRLQRLIAAAARSLG